MRQLAVSTAALCAPAATLAGIACWLIVNRFVLRRQDRAFGVAVFTGRGSSTLARLVQRACVEAMIAGCAGHVSVGGTVDRAPDGWPRPR